jgi:hypothetical protein
MDTEQQERFREAVERKAQEAEDASRAKERPTGDNPGPIHGDQAPDVPSEREKSSRHGQVTADKWNQ